MLERPQLDREDERYFAVVVALQRERPILGGGLVVLPLPVPRITIEQQARRMGVDDGEIVEFVEIVARIDDMHVEREAKRIQAETKAAGKKG